MKDNKFIKFITSKYLILAVQLFATALFNLSIRSSTIKILDSSDRGIRFINYNFLLYHEERAKEN